MWSLPARDTLLGDSINLSSFYGFKGSTKSAKLASLRHYLLFVLNVGNCCVSAP